MVLPVPTPDVDESEEPVWTPRVDSDGDVFYDRYHQEDDDAECPACIARCCWQKSVIYEGTGQEIVIHDCWHEMS